MNTKEKKFKTKPITTAIGSLYTVAGIAERFHITERVLRELSAGDFIPHYRMKGHSDPLFHVDEAKEWIQKNLVQRHSGCKLPEVRFLVVSDDDSKRPPDIPKEIAAVDNLHEFCPAMFCGIYFLCRADKVVYVGKSVSIFNRVGQHKADKKDFDRILFLRVPESQLDEVEREYIKALRPPLNRTYIKRSEVAA